MIPTSLLDLEQLERMATKGSATFVRRVFDKEIILGLITELKQARAVITEYKIESMIQFAEAPKGAKTTYGSAKPQNCTA